MLIVTSLYLQASMPVSYYHFSRDPQLKDSDGGHKIRVSEFTVQLNNPNRANHSSEIVILEVVQPEANHEGGMFDRINGNGQNLGLRVFF